MLIYTYKLERYIKNKIFPKILLVPDKYIIKGSFRRKIPYVTDIDIVNNVYPEINRTNIYKNLVQLLKKLQTNKDTIILAYIKCGTDDRFKLINGSNEEVDRIRPLLFPEEQKEIDATILKYQENPTRKLFYLNEQLRPYYKLRWSPAEVIEDRKILRGNIEIKFNDIVNKNSSLLLKYYIRIGSYPIGADVVIVYEPVDMKTIYEIAGDYQIRFANYAREYYYMLFPFRYYFRNDKNKLEQLNEIIEKKFGLYKQLMVRIDTYITLYKSNNLDIKTATGIITSILKDLPKLPIFNSNIPDKIREVSINNPPDVKMAQWYTLLDTLYDEINVEVNSAAKEYFFKFLEMLPPNVKDNFYLRNLRNLRTLMT